ncbi:MAG TPA: helix-turn-helix domain-containing protein [Halanaerobiaceae bacterium]|nr:helix-turn-helix domain-containing protein [Halanaerobiaceae bacterium]
MSIGEILKKAREEKGLTYKEIQNAIKIRAKYLEALENNDFDVIPGEAYVKAFLKGYGNHLGLEGDQLVEEYINLKEEEKRLLEEEGDNNKEGNGFFQKKGLISIIIALIILLVLAILIYNIGLLNNSRNELQVNQGIDNNQNISMNHQLNSLEDERVFDRLNNNDDLGIGIEGKEDNELEDTGGEGIINKTFQEEGEVHTELTLKELEIIITERSWLQVFADGEKVYEGIMEEGENKNIAYKNNISMKIGNAAGVKVKKGQEILGPWGNKGQVIEKILD